MLVLLPIEVASGFLYRLTKVVVGSFKIQTGKDAPNLLGIITDPFTDHIIKVWTSVVNVVVCVSCTSDDNRDPIGLMVPSDGDTMAQQLVLLPQTYRNRGFDPDLGRSLCGICT